MSALVEAVRSIINLSAEGEWSIIDRIAPGGAISAVDLKRAVHEYGRTLVRAPDNFWDDVYLVAMHAGGYAIQAPFWTREEGRSDLEISMTAREVASGLWAIQLDGALVP